MCKVVHNRSQMIKYLIWTFALAYIPEGTFRGGREGRELPAGTFCGGCESQELPAGTFC